MKIAIIGANKLDSMEFHLADAFHVMGHHVMIFDIYNQPRYKSKTFGKYFLAIDKFRRSYSDSFDAKKYVSLAHKVEDFNPDLVVCLYKDIHPSFVKIVKKSNRKVVHINPDTFNTLGYQQVFAADYDAWFTKEPYMEHFMKNNMHLNVFLYHEAFNHRYNPKPAEEKAIVENRVGLEVMTYGTLYPYRTRMLKNIIDAGINLKLFGTIPHRFFNEDVAKACTGKYIIGKEKSEAIYGSKIALNNLLFAEIESVNCRFYEINGCGGFQLCDYRPMLEEVLPIDPELVSYKSVDECIEKIKYYLVHSNERYEIAQKIYSHFIENYTYDNLVSHILNVVNNL